MDKSTKSIAGKDDHDLEGLKSTHRGGGVHQTHSASQQGDICLDRSKQPHLSECQSKYVSLQEQVVGRVVYSLLVEGDKFTVHTSINRL